MSASTRCSRNLILASGSPRRIEMMRARGYEPLVLPADIEENLPLRCGMTETVMFLALKKAKDVEARYLAAQPQPEGTDKGGCKGEGETRTADKAADKTTCEDAVLPPIIIAADTTVYKDEIMGKPADKADGFRMLSALRKDVHYVVTGVALVEAGAQNARVFYEITKVFFKDYSDEELSAYLDTDEAYDKAGGYAIQGYFSRYTDHIEGDYDNVVGFPWKRIEKELDHFI